MPYYMSFTDAIKSCLTKYFTISGRARRSEYWYFVLFHLLLLVSPYILALSTVIIGDDERFFSLFVILYCTANFGLIIPNFTVKIRRLHDTGHSGWNLLWYLVPAIGPLIMLVYLVSDSQLGVNQYGPNPKGVYCKW